MSKKRGLSLNEKQGQMLKIFHETQDFFQLKDLERLGLKNGVISQSVKDVVQSLVDDGLVLKDKIGSSVYFWSLPSSTGNQVRQCQKKLRADLDSAEKLQKELQLQKEQAKVGKEESTEREAALRSLTDLENEHEAVEKELELYTENDPSLYEAMKNARDVAHTAANRWTDNVFILQQWLNNRFPEAQESLQQMYSEVGITEDFDYLEP